MWPSGSIAVQYLDATNCDADSIAALHADSWRRHYRGAYLDSYLDGDVVADRRGGVAKPTGATHARATSRWSLARETRSVGFAHTLVDEDPLVGITPRESPRQRVTLKRTRDRFTPACQQAVRRPSFDFGPNGSLHLWVLDQNTAAQAFYDARGGQPSRDATPRALSRWRPSDWVTATTGAIQLDY